MVRVQANSDFGGRDGPLKLSTPAAASLRGVEKHVAARRPLPALCGRGRAAGGIGERLQLMTDSCLPLRKSSVLT